MSPEARIPALSPSPPPAGTIARQRRRTPATRARPRRQILRGRDEPLEAVSVALDRVRSGDAGAVVLVEGATGMGKTRLLDEAARIARRLDFSVGRGGAEPGE